MGRFWRICLTWIILSITIFISDNKFNFLATNYGRGYNEPRPLFSGVADDEDMMQRYGSFIHMERFSLLFFV